MLVRTGKTAKLLSIYFEYFKWVIDLVT